MWHEKLFFIIPFDTLAFPIQRITAKTKLTTVLKMLETKLTQLKG